MVSAGKGFLLGGTLGFLALFEFTEDPGQPFDKTRTLQLGPSFPFRTLLSKPMSNQVYAVCDNQKLCHFTLGELSTDMEGVEDEPEEVMKDVLQGGFHSGKILDLDTCVQKPIVATVGADRTLRIWNFQTKTTEVVETFTSEFPTSVSLHPLGFHAAVGFQERVRFLSITENGIVDVHDYITKNVSKVVYSNGGHLIAIASGFNITLLNAFTFQELWFCQGHSMAVRELKWLEGDRYFVSSSPDGNVYAWDVLRQKRIDVSPKSSRANYCQTFLLLPSISRDSEEEDSIAGGGSSDNLMNRRDGRKSSSLSMRSSSRLGRESKKEEEDKEEEDSEHDLEVDDANKRGKAQMKMNRCCNQGILAMNDGYLRFMFWNDNGLQEHEEPIQDLKVEASGGKLKAFASIFDGNILLLGFSNGLIQAHAFPLTESSPKFQIQAHNAAVVSIKVSKDSSQVFSIGEDGSLFAFDVLQRQPMSMEGSLSSTSTGGSFHRLSKEIMLRPYEPLEPMYNLEVVMLGRDVWFKMEQERDDLEKDIQTLTSQHEFDVHKIRSQHKDEVKVMNDQKQKEMGSQREVYDTQISELRKEIDRLNDRIQEEELDHTHMTNELEKRYEKKLVNQMDRYDLLHEEMEVLKQQCQGVLEAQSDEHDASMKDIEKTAKEREKKLKSENSKLKDDKKEDERTFKEILDQQELEYENEL
jgi:WD40 repeat protein